MVLHITLFLKCCRTVCTLEWFLSIVHSHMVGKTVKVHESFPAYITFVLMLFSTESTVSLVVTFLLELAATPLTYKLPHIRV